MPGRASRASKLAAASFPVPVNPDDPDSPTIDLKVAVVPALTLEPEPDAFVPIAGGPGQSTIEFYAGYATAFESVRRNRDIVLMDQRGTGESAPMTCEIDEDIIQGAYSREQTIEATGDLSRRLAARSTLFHDQCGRPGSRSPACRARLLVRIQCLWHFLRHPGRTALRSPLSRRPHAPSSSMA